MEAPLERHPSLGERSDPAITIAPYDPDWPRAFEFEETAIREALGDLAVRIEHVGSTAVAGLPGKPVIDIQVSVARLEPRDAYLRPLGQLGYLFAADPDSPDFHFFGKPVERPRRYHVHVCESGSEHEQRHLAVRDFLRAHPDEARRYAEVKRDLITRHPGDRLAYIEGKQPFMDALEQRAMKWRTPQPDTLSS